MNDHIKIYIGDFRINTESMEFIEEYDRSIITSRPLFGNKIPVVDIDYLNIDQKELEWMIEKANRPIRVCTMYPDKVPKKVSCEIVYKDGVIKESTRVYEFVKEIFHCKDRLKIWGEMEGKKHPQMLVHMWLQSNPTPENTAHLSELDKWSMISNVDLWNTYVPLRIKNGPQYVRYRFPSRHTK